MLFSRARRRTRGELRTRRRLPACGPARGWRTPPASGRNRLPPAPPAPCLPAAASRRLRPLHAAAAAAAVSITATTVWTGTVCPSATLISRSTPAAGEGISASTLSVEISNSGSSRSTLSPGFLSHLVTVPSKMLSPIWGMTTSTAMESSPVLLPASRRSAVNHDFRRHAEPLVQFFAPGGTPSPAPWPRRILPPGAAAPRPAPRAGRAVFRARSPGNRRCRTARSGRNSADRSKRCRRSRAK